LAKKKKGFFCASLFLKMNLGINFFLDSRFLVDFEPAICLFEKALIYLL